MDYGKNKKLDSASYIKELKSIANNENFLNGLNTYPSPDFLYNFLSSLEGLDRRDAALRILGHGIRYIEEMGPTIEIKLLLKAAQESGILDTINEEIFLDLVNYASELVEERQQRIQTIKSHAEEGDSFTGEFLKKIKVEPTY